MPYTGAFHVYAKQFIGPATGFTVAILYWLTWTIALGSEFTAAGLIMQTWFPHSPVWLWSLLFIILIFLVNAFSVRLFAESEFWFAAIKVFAIVGFILLGGLAVLGILPIKGYSHAPLFTNIFKDGLFPNGIGGVFTTMLTVNFAFSGTELIGITAGEAKNPDKTIPKAIHTTLWRLVIFFIGSIVIMSCLIPYQQAGVTQSPFVHIFKLMGIPFAADLMNFVVLTAIVSAANSVYLILVSISGLAVVLVWMAIALAEINFRKQFLAKGHSLAELKFKTPYFPILPYFAFGASLLSCLLIYFDKNQRLALYCTVPFVLLCYLGYYLCKPKSHWVAKRFLLRDNRFIRKWCSWENLAN